MSAEELRRVICELREKSDSSERNDLMLLSRDAAARSELESGRLSMHVVACDPEHYDGELEGAHTAVEVWH